MGKAHGSKNHRLRIKMTFAITVLSLLTSAFVFVWAHRAYVWNRGVCRKNGLPWRLEYQDMHGSKLWKAGDVEVWL